jgi:hypothetical protein
MSTFYQYVTCFAAFVGCAFSQSMPPLTSWVELGPGGQIIARVVLSAPPCPAITIPGSSISMQTRSGPITNFAVTVCEAVIPASAKSATLGGVPLPLPNAASVPAVVGDTGCKGNTLGAGQNVQPEEDDDDLTPDPEAAASVDCGDPTNWPLNQIATTIAARQPPPGLVIHVGDYIYIKTESSDAKSASPDSWDAWRTQFFAPAQPLLAKSAWLFVRGNHETCGRHGPGYFLFLDPRPYDPNSTNCSDATSPYLVPFANTQYVVLDSSGATCDFAGEKCSGDTKITSRKDQVTTWTALMEAADKAIPKGSTGVLLTHRPVWGAKAEKLDKSAATCPVEKGRGIIALNSVLQDAWNKAPTKRISMVLAGHTHTWALIEVKGEKPQLVAGNGGTTLNKHPGPTSASDCDIATTMAGKPYLRADTINGFNQWGFTILNSNQQLTAFDQTGKQLLSCSLGSGKGAECK